MSGNILACTELVKAYHKKEVIKGVNLELEQGKIYGLIGRNGAGKTTLLSLLTAQNPQTSGSVTWNGVPVWENQEILDHLCFSREISPVTGLGANNMKVKEYLKAASQFMPGWDAEMEKRLVKEFELDVKKKIFKLSKGMLSMVTIIVALASKADFTFLDEPVAGLDVVTRDYFYRLLLEEFNKTGRTFVISTHIIEEAADLFEEVILLDRGNILLKENAQELIERAFHVSGREEDVEAATAGHTVCHRERIGRSMGATILVEKGRRFLPGESVTVQPMTLQQVFVALCGREEQK